MPARCWQLCLLLGCCTAAQALQVDREVEHSLGSKGYSPAGKLMGEFKTAVRLARPLKPLVVPGPNPESVLYSTGQAHGTLHHMTAVQSRYSTQQQVLEFERSSLPQGGRSELADLVKDDRQAW